MHFGPAGALEEREEQPGLDRRVGEVRELPWRCKELYMELYIRTTQSLVKSSRRPGLSLAWDVGLTKDYRLGLTKD